MANENNKVSFKDINMHDRDMVSSRNSTIEFGDIKITVRPYLTLSEMIQFVADVVHDSFIGEDPVYYPEIKQFNIDRNIIEKYTNLEMPSDANELYTCMIIFQKLIERVKSKINRVQFDQIMKAIDERIDYVNSSRISDLTKQMNELYGMVDTIGSQFGSMFENIEASDIQNLVGALAGAQVDEEKIVSAITSLRKE